MLYRRSQSKHVLLGWASNEQTRPREEEEEDVFGTKVGGRNGGGGRESREKEVLSLRSLISTCPRLDVNTNTNRKLFKVAPFVHNALAVGYSLFRRHFQTKNGRERGRRAQTISGSWSVTFALGDDQIEAPPSDGMQLNRVENSSALAVSPFTKSAGPTSEANL